MATNPSVEKATLGAGPGRRARSPLDIPLRGWRQIAARTAGRWGRANIVLIAGGVSFFVILSAAPAMIALVSVYAIFSNPAAAAAHASLLITILPPNAYAIFETIFVGLAGSRDASLAVGFFVSFAFALWGANSGMRQFCAALTILEDETTERSLVRQIAVSLALTIGAIVLFTVAAIVVTLLPTILDAAKTKSQGGLIYFLNWLALFAVAASYGAVVYRYGPDRAAPRWRWTAPGAIAASFLWAAMSNLFTAALAGFEGFNDVYGPLAGVVTMMFWVFLSTIVFLLGGAFNAEAERQTARDTTTGAEKPIGARNAIPADEIGAHPDLKALRKAAGPVFAKKEKAGKQPRR